jgi:sulfate adenylyltransferase
VGNYYGKYAAQKLSRDFNNLGIEILELCGPYYCRKCGTVVTEKTCPHGEQHAVSISGTQMRALFAKRERPPEEYMRPEISAVLLRLYEQKKLFCGDAASEFSRNR